jgi:signal transduction histidine kinase
LRNRLEAGLKDNADEAPRAALAKSIDDVDGLLETFNAVLRLSRVQAGATGSFRRTDLRAMIDELAELYQPVCEEKNLSWVYEPRGELFVLADSHLIAQALSNLLDNAVKYTPVGGAVRMSAHHDVNGDVEIAVVDSGVGIPPQDRERVIERFVRLEQSRSEPGSGLGLSLASAVAEAHSGKLVLADGDGPPDRPGLKAKIVLPAA